MSDRSWERHSNPWSGWTRLLTYPLVFVAVWHHDGVLVLALVAWFLLNPRLFPKPADERAWMTRGVLGERLWTHQPRVDASLFITLAMTPLFGAAIYTAWMQWLWPTLLLAIAVAGLKLWFIARMVSLYDGSGPGKGTREPQAPASATRE